MFQNIARNLTVLDVLQGIAARKVSTFVQLSIV